MPVQITSDNLDITPSMQSLVASKSPKLLERLKDLPEDMYDLRVVMNKGSAVDTFEARVTLNIGSKLFASEETEYSMESALIRAIDELLRQYEKDKDKKDSSKWEDIRNAKVFEYSDDDE